MRILLALFILFSTSCAQAQCVATIKDVRLDDLFHYVLVETEYTLNGKVVEIGHTRYNDVNGTTAEIIALVKYDVDKHCENLILRIESNVAKMQDTILVKEEELAIPIIANIKDDLIGYSVSKDEVNQEYKGVIVTLKANDEAVVDDIIVTP